MKQRVRKTQTKEGRRKKREGCSLAQIGLKDSTLRRYREAVHKAFEEWDFLSEDYENLVSFDLALGDLLEYAYEQGESVSFAGDLLSGIQTFLPFLRKQLSYSWHLFGLWRKNERSWQATPLSCAFLWAMVSRMAELGNVPMAFPLAAGFFGLFRTGELMLMSFATKTSNRLGPGEHVVIREPGVLHLAATLLSLSPRRGLIWQRSHQEFQSQFEKLVAFFGLESRGYRPCSLRRGGATHLYRQQTPMELILMKGRWRNSNSARLYISDGMTVLANLHRSRKTKKLFRWYRNFIGYSSSSLKTSW